MNKIASFLAALALFIAPSLSASPIALRVDVSPRSVSETGTVMSIRISLAPDDADRIGSWPRLRVKLLDGKQVLAHVLQDVDFDAQGRLRVEYEWPPGSHELRLTIEDSRGNVLGAWDGRIDIPSTLEPPQPTPNPVPKPKPTAPPPPEKPEPTAPPEPIPMPKPTGPPAAEPVVEHPAPEETQLPAETTPAEAAAPDVAPVAEPPAPEPAHHAAIEPPAPEVEPPVAETPETRPAAEPEPAKAPRDAQPEPARPEPASPEATQTEPAEPEPAAPAAPAAAAAVPYVVRSADEPAPAPAPEAASTAPEPATPPPPAVVSPFVLVLDVHPGDSELINRAADLRDQVERRAGEPPRLVIPSGEDGPAPAIAQAVSTVGVDTRAVVVISDGRTKSSRGDWKTAAEAATMVRIPIVILGLYNDAFEPTTRNRFSDLATDTGGGSFVLQPAEVPDRAMAVLGEVFARSREP